MGNEITDLEGNSYSDNQNMVAGNASDCRELY